MKEHGCCNKTWLNINYHNDFFFHRLHSWGFTSKKDFQRKHSLCLKVFFLNHRIIHLTFLSDRSHSLSRSFLRIFAGALEVWECLNSLFHFWSFFGASVIDFMINITPKSKGCEKKFLLILLNWLTLQVSMQEVCTLYQER